VTVTESKFKGALREKISGPYMLYIAMETAHYKIPV
jgi:hypothetical protein